MSIKNNMTNEIYQLNYNHLVYTIRIERILSAFSVQRITTMLSVHSMRFYSYIVTHPTSTCHSGAEHVPLVQESSHSDLNGE